MPKKLARMIRVASIKQHVTDKTVLLETKSRTANFELFQDVSFVGDVPDSKSLHAECFAYSDHTHLFRCPGCAKGKQPCRRFEIGRYSSIAIIRLCIGNIFACWCYGKPTRPSGKRHFILSHLVDHFSFLIRLIIFQATFQRVHLQPDNTFSRTTSCQPNDHQRSQSQIETRVTKSPCRPELAI